MFPTFSNMFPTFSIIFQHFPTCSRDFAMFSPPFCWPQGVASRRRRHRLRGGGEALPLRRGGAQVGGGAWDGRNAAVEIHNASHYSAEDYHNQIHIMDTYIYIPSTFASSIYRGHFMWTRFLTQEPSFRGFHPKRPYFVNPRFVSFEGSFGNLTPFIGSISPAKVWFQDREWLKCHHFSGIFLDKRSHPKERGVHIQSKWRTMRQPYRIQLEFMGPLKACRALNILKHWLNQHL